jgi:hypothetical protein
VRGPIKERSGGRVYAVDDLEDDLPVEADIDNVATTAKAEETAAKLDEPEKLDEPDGNDEE